MRRDFDAESACKNNAGGKRTPILCVSGPKPGDVLTCVWFVLLVSAEKPLFAVTAAWASGRVDVYSWMRLSSAPWLSLHDENTRVSWDICQTEVSPPPHTHTHLPYSSSAPNRTAPVSPKKNLKGNWPAWFERHGDWCESSLNVAELLNHDSSSQRVSCWSAR